MEAVAADTVLLIVLVGQGVHVSLGGHGAVEGGIKHDHVGLIHAEHLAGGLQAQQAGGGVQGGQGRQLINGLDDFVGHQAALLELLAAVHAAMADGVDLVDAVDDLAFALGHHLNQLGKRFGVRGEGSVGLHLVAAHLMGDAAAFAADALAQALAQDLLGLHIKQLILQRRRAAIDNQNFHWFVFLRFILRAGQGRTRTARDFQSVISII